MDAVPLGMRQGVVMFVTSSVANFLAYLLHVFLSRMLGPAEYGVFASLLSVFVLLSVPAMIVRMVVAKYVSRFHAREEAGKIAAFLVAALKWISVGGILATLALILSSGYVAAYLQIPSAVPVIVIATMTLVGTLMSVATGALQGLQKFRALGANMVLAAGSRFILAVGLVALGLGASGALASSTLSGALAFGTALVPLSYLFRQRDACLDVQTRDIFQYSAVVFLGLLCFTALTNVDLVVVKHYFDPVDTGHYSAASVLARIILFFPGGIGVVMFPKASSNFALNRDSTVVIRKTILAVAVLCGLLVAAYSLFPALLVSALFGEGYEASVPLIGIYGLAMSLFALINTLLLYYLSVQNIKFVWLLLVSTVVQILALNIFHDSLRQVIYVLVLVSTLTLLVGEILCRGLTGMKLDKLAHAYESAPAE